MRDTYVCANCGKTFPYATDWTDEDARAEYAAAGYTDPIEEAAIVCDECWKAIIARQQAWEATSTITDG